ncbi:hypothetical protein [Streptomyces sp. A1136]|uniref:hypothetical protein n=1 Tax=Streptomyces sp. A1136 TaxID=2563102 RepID=UPI00109EA47D|nr:hypothetical protein [Streptomyces sp. A1136]THA49423.1 hypothetical protein E6R62_27950 [Streptomyces sp. A1136]
MTTARQHQTHTARRRLLAATAVTAVTATVAVLTAGCTSDAKEDKASTPRPGLSTSPSASTDPQAAEKSKALAAYSGFWTESVKAYETGTEKDTKLVNFAAKTALNDALTDLANMRKAGTVTKGSPGHRPEVTAVNMAGEHPGITITDCLDLSTWQTVDRATGKVQPYPPEQPLRYVAVAETELWAGQWMVVKMTPDGDRRC